MGVAGKLFVAATWQESQLEHGLALADAIVYATARTEGVEVVTSNADFEGLPDVHYFGKKRSGTRPKPKKS